MSSIEWTDATWNPVVGCTPVSPGCLNCYAATMARRLESMGTKGYEPRERKDAERAAGNGADTDVPDDRKTIRIAEVRGGRAVFTGEVRCLPERLREPLSWKKPRMIFVNSMSDLFHEAVPFEFIDRVFAVMALCPRHTFQVLTKRPERMAEYFVDIETLEDRIYEAVEDLVESLCLKICGLQDWILGGLPLSNVWLGTSTENQATADERIPHLLRCPAAVRFLSVEPMLGPVDLRRVPNTSPPMPGCPNGAPSRRVDWVICGGESGAGARPFDVAWARSLRDQCKSAGVPFFMKQMGRVVHCRNDKVSDWLEEVGMGLDYIDTSETRMQGDPVRVMLNNAKGSDMNEWPEDLRIREMPAVASLS